MNEMPSDQQKKGNTYEGTYEHVDAAAMQRQIRERDIAFLQSTEGKYLSLKDIREKLVTYLIFKYNFTAKDAQARAKELTRELAQWSRSIEQGKNDLEKNRTNAIADGSWNAGMVQKYKEGMAEYDNIHHVNNELFLSSLAEADVQIAAAQGESDMADVSKKSSAQKEKTSDAREVVDPVPVEHPLVETPAEVNVPPETPERKREPFEKTPEYLQAQEVWRSAKENSDRLQTEYEQALRAHYAAWSEKGGFTKIKRAFGGKPKLTPELSELHKKTIAARQEYRKAAVALVAERYKGRDIPQYREGRDPRSVYQEKLANKLIVDPQARMLEMQSEYVKESPLTKKLFGFLSKHKNAIRVGQVVAAGIAAGVLTGGTSVVAVAGAATLASGLKAGKIALSAVVGGWAGKRAYKSITESASTKAKTKEAEEKIAAKKDRSRTSLFDEGVSIEGLDADLLASIEALAEHNRRTRKKALWGAAGAGVLTGLGVGLSEAGINASFLSDAQAAEIDTKSGIGNSEVPTEESKLETRHVPDHDIVPGDTLWHISEDRYTESGLLEKIPEAKRDAFLVELFDKLEEDAARMKEVGIRSEDPDTIYAGEKLHIAALDSLAEEIAEKYILEESVPGAEELTAENREGIVPSSASTTPDADVSQNFDVEAEDGTDIPTSEPVEAANTATEGQVSDAYVREPLLSATLTGALEGSFAGSAEDDKRFAAQPKVEEETPSPVQANEEFTEEADTTSEPIPRAARTDVVPPPAEMSEKEVVQRVKGYVSSIEKNRGGIMGLFFREPSMYDVAKEKGLTIGGMIELAQAGAEAIEQAGYPLTQWEAWVDIINEQKEKRPQQTFAEFVRERALAQTEFKA